MSSENPKDFSKTLLEKENSKHTSLNLAEVKRISSLLQKEVAQLSEAWDSYAQKTKDYMKNVTELELQLKSK